MSNKLPLGDKHFEEPVASESLNILEFTGKK
ncbi:hypothetical protein SAMN05880501_104312 [Ureibacillus xyleni]|uniref:Uncharacterized protein n=1 Tax=Ureibacillus xyleni TaxID=614648 RepID=A0A285SGR5_9BACL|nr:hypothetical protein SAMN05880501_104312 [Ureibacillus xyleni]